MIRRFVALLMMLMLMAAQASALVCPAAHHPAKPTHASDTSHASHDIPAESSQDRTIPEHCMMVTSCGVITPLAPLAQGIHPATSYIAPFVLDLGQYTAPILAQVTPPPRSV